MSHQLEEEMDQEKIAKLTREILGDRYQSVGLIGWKKKPPNDHEVEFYCSLRFAGETVDAIGTGPDLLHAAFEAFKRKFSECFPSLKAWREPRSFERRDELHFELATSQNEQRFRFTVPLKGREKDDALVEAMKQAVEFFVNAERAYAATRQALTLIQAQDQGRADLISTHTERLTALVEVADFQEVVALIRADKYPSL